MDVLLALDMSTTCTGWAKYNLETLELIGYGIIKPKVDNPVKKGIPKYKYPEYQLRKMRDISAQICIELLDENVKKIVIEEINDGTSRIGQKVLDGLHFVFLDHIREIIQKVYYVDSDGAEGWRSKKGLGLQLSEQDKLTNKERKKINKQIKEYNSRVKNKKDKKKYVHVVTQKDLACRFANKKYGTNFSVEKNPEDGDKADAVCLGHCFIHHLSGIGKEVDGKR